MEEKKRQIAKISIFITSIFVIFISISYAFITQTLAGTKRQVINAGVLDLVLEEDNGITISDALPMYDEVGMIQEENYVFRLINNTSTDTNYVLKLNKIETSNLDENLVKYGLVKDGISKIALLSTLQNGVIDEGTIDGSATQNYELRLWIDSSVTDDTLISGKTLSYTLSIEVNQINEGQPESVIIGGIEQEVKPVTTSMFNYTSEGKYISDYNEWIVETDTNYVTNGIYAMEDDDAVSYFYRGDVDNLVKFGSYTKDYEVYRYTSDYGTYDFVTLEACQFYNSSCSEANKVIKYVASDNVPMYWRIIRINGDGTIRMIYAGTTPDATGYETGIGISRYNEEDGDPKYTGYTYDRTTTEVNSDAKTEIDTWYANVFKGTTYDDLIAEGKFCSDSSEYGEVTDLVGETYNAFGALKRLLPSYYNLEGNVSPTFKCAVTAETYGGSYNLKAGLITADEVVAAGGKGEIGAMSTISNDSYYLYNGTKGNSDGNWFWTMSPYYFYDIYADAFVGTVEYDGSFSRANVPYTNSSWTDGLLRPVINLRADITFKSGTDGSVLTPYELAE